MGVAELSIGEKLVLLGGVLAVVGSVLPWTGSGLVGGVGLGGREIIALLVGIVAVGLLYVADWTASAQLIAVVLGLVATGLAGYTLAETVGVIGSGTLAPSLGLYVSLLAGLLILGGGAHTYTDSEPEAGMYSHR
ncbi:hypothetical protein GRX03_03815 [Halovenus sp. WSH3]|uniref:Uncharacterized protein n=1 Tax=Halovenus carboxidivorans TaxID=2692199 RepID=A0A6B0T628_9EURY|nr:hypothetical protein [Halovenus carboxidivorans]MXR50732.1 hypothetical protein [Halovenus carboxidivorans]